MKMKLNAALIAAIVLVGGSVPGLRAEKGKQHDRATHDRGKEHAEKKTSKVTLRGEVIDLSCYMAHEGKGAKHRKCAKACILGKGLPMGLLTEEGKVFFLIEDHAKAKVYKQVKELAAEQVEISGNRYDRGGTVAVSVKALKKL